MTSHCTRGPVITLHDFGSVLGWPLNTSFGLSRFHGHGSWLVCEVALGVMYTIREGPKLDDLEVSKCCLC